MDLAVLGLHHVTAVSADIVGNLLYYTGPLGMRLVKKSVNQDDVSAYHLFYADGAGTPGTDLTFFDWPDSGTNRPGPGAVSLTTMRVPKGALDFWEARLPNSVRDTDAQGRDRLTFADPEGQALALVDDAGLPDDSVPFDRVVPTDKAIRGLYSVDIPTPRPDMTTRVLTELLGFEETNVEGLLEARTDRTVGQVRVTPGAGRTLARVGAGGVHHVAFRVRDEDHLLALQAKVEAAGLRTSGEVDRYWFRSVYFREPGGTLFELATEGPGFAVDEDVTTLGENTTLAPFLEPRRAEIEANLKPLPLPAYASVR
jgi:glyoxalase family protein